MTKQNKARTYRYDEHDAGAGRRLHRDIMEDVRAGADPIAGLAAAVDRTEAPVRDEDSDHSDDVQRSGPRPRGRPCKHFTPTAHQEARRAYQKRWLAKGGKAALRELERQRDFAKECGNTRQLRAKIRDLASDKKSLKAKVAKKDTRTIRQRARKAQLFVEAHELLLAVFDSFKRLEDWRLPRCDALNPEKTVLRQRMRRLDEEMREHM